MRAGASLGWRVATAVAFAATAALAVTLSRGAPIHVALTSDKDRTHPAHSRAPPAGGRGQRCAVSGLRISLGPGARVTAAITRYPLDFTNVSDSPCTLAGYPEVSAYRGDGIQVGPAAVQDTSVAASRVLLAPGRDRARGPGRPGACGAVPSGPRVRAARRHARPDGRPLRPAPPDGLRRPRLPRPGLPARPCDPARHGHQRKRRRQHRHGRRFAAIGRTRPPGHARVAARGPARLTRPSVPGAAAAVTRPVRPCAGQDSQCRGGRRF